MGRSRWGRDCTLVDPSRRSRAQRSLVERAIFSNPSIEIAVTRIKIARANEIATRGAALPDSGSASAQRGGTGTNSARGRVTTPAFRHQFHRPERDHRRWRV